MSPWEAKVESPMRTIGSASRTFLLTSALAGFVSTSSITFVVVPTLLVLVTAAACYILPAAHRWSIPWWLCATNDAGDESVGSVMLVVP